MHPNAARFRPDLAQTAAGPIQSAACRPINIDLLLKTCLSRFPFFVPFSVLFMRRR
jgi:hypothetical protein